MGLRFSDNPLQNPVTGTERIPATDTSTGSDVAIAPAALVAFTRSTMGGPNGSGDGLMSQAQSDKLDDLRTNAENDAINEQFQQIPFPIFIGTADDTVVTLYRNVLDNNVTLDYFYASCGSGETDVTLTIEGAPVTGMTSIGVGNTDVQAFATAANVLAPGDKLGLILSNGTGAVNLFISLRGVMELT